jgi:hypothetical protein
VVIAFALVVSIGLGWVKFVRQRAHSESSAAVVSRDAGATGAIEDRVSALEARLDAAGAALGGENARKE